MMRNCSALVSGSFGKWDPIAPIRGKEVLYSACFLVLEECKCWMVSRRAPRFFCCSHCSLQSVSTMAAPNQIVMDAQDRINDRGLELVQQLL